MWPAAVVAATAVMVEMVAVAPLVGPVAVVDTEVMAETASQTAAHIAAAVAAAAMEERAVMAVQWAAAVAAVTDQMATAGMAL